MGLLNRNAEISSTTPENSIDTTRNGENGENEVDTIISEINNGFKIAENLPILSSNLCKDVEDVHLTVQLAVNYIKLALNPYNKEPTIGIICGSGLSDIGEIIKEPFRIPYEKVPGMSYSKVSGHHNVIIVGNIEDKQVICFQGRSHYYEGVPMSVLVLPIRIMKMLGVKSLIITNASGRINPSYNVGDIMVIKDHINFLALSGQNPLRGENDPRFGERFPNMLNSYDKKLRWKCKRAFSRTGLQEIYREGIYCCLGGPSYETRAELRLIKAISGDAVGMSTGPEVVVARHCGLKVCGLSLITNKVDFEDTKEDLDSYFEGWDENNLSNGNTNHETAASATDLQSKDIEDEEMNHQQVLEAATKGVKNMATIIKELVSKEM